MSETNLLNLIKKLRKQLQKTERRLAKKNQKMMDLNKVKNALQRELEETKLRIKDLEFLLDEKDKEIAELEKELDMKYSNVVEELREENKKLKSQLESLKKELAEKDATIELLQKAEINYKGIVSLDIHQIKTKWLGWPEGANLEEIDLVLVNNTTDVINDLNMDLIIEDINKNVYKYDNYPLHVVLNPKQRVVKKLHLFKQLPKKGAYKLTVKLYLKDHPKEIAEQSKIFFI